MKVTSFGGTTFASLNLSAGVPRGAEPGPEFRPLVLDRRGYAPVHVGVNRGIKVLEVSCKVLPGFNLENGLLSALGMSDPFDETERLLVGQLNDTTAIQAYGALAGYRWESADTIMLTFSLADPIWRKPTATTYGPLTWQGTVSAPNAPAVLAVPNAGKARANLNVKLVPTNLDTTVDEFSSRKTFTVTNNSDQTLRRFPLEINLGDTTSGWETNANLIWLFLDGVPQVREFININSQQTYMWMLVDELGPGLTFTYELAWPGPSSTHGLTGTNRLAFGIEWSNETATSGGSNTFTKSTATWRADQWRRGEITILSGTGAGQTRKISTNSGTVITTETNWTTNPASGSVALITQSHNDRWVYDCAPISRSNLNRGLWYQNSGQNVPQIVEFDTPAAWFRYLYTDNNDEKNNRRWFSFDVGGGDIDYFNGLYAERTAQGWSSLREEGQADGVSFSSPVEIDGFRFYYSFKNPNSIARAMFGFRDSGSEDWDFFLSDAAAHDAFTLSSVQDQSFTSDVRHLIATLQPANEEEIPVSWKRDTGSVTAATSTTLTDDTKEWSTDQWDNGSVRIVAGTATGSRGVITGSNSTQLTVSSWSNGTPATDSRYEVRNKKLVAGLWGQYTWEVRLNTSKVTTSALSSTIFPSYAFKHNLNLNGGPNGISPSQDIRIGMDGRYIHIAGTEELRIDGAVRRAAIYTTSTGAKVKDVSSAVLVRNKETDGNSYLAADWLLIQPTPANVVVDPNFAAGNISQWAQFQANTSGVTCTPAYDGAQGHLANGSLTMNVTASTAVAGATVQWATPASAPYFAVVPGKAYTVTAWGRRSSTNWRPLLGIAWYDSTPTLISSGIATNGVDYVATNTTWYQIGHALLAPSNAAFARVIAVAYETVNSTTGQVWFDEVIFDNDALFFNQQTTGITTAVTPTLSEGFFG